MRKLYVPLLAALCLAAAATSWASAPGIMSFQGRLTNSSGTPLFGTYSVQFSIYGDSTGPFWGFQETKSITTDANGLFSTLLGSTTAIQYFNFDDMSLYLGVKIGADPELTPRTRLATAPYAFAVASIAGATGGAILSSLYITGSVNVNGDNNVNGYQVVTSPGGGNAIFGKNLTAGGANNVGVRGDAFNSTNLNAAVYGEAEDANGATNSAAIYGVAHSNNGGTVWAGYFDGWAKVNGSFYAAAKFFQIDDPVDPANSIMQHACVESDEYKNVYDGVITTDASGNASIQLPTWFGALNKDFRYQLTCIGQFAQAIVSQKIVTNEFNIKTDKPNVEVSWQVTGVRKDAYAAAHPVHVQKAKPEALRGKYLNPIENGVDEQLGVDYAARRAADEARAKAEAQVNAGER